VETVVNWAQIIGALLALVAVILAARQLSRAEDFQRQARRDLREDNRTDFFLGLVAEIADSIAELNEHNVARIGARLRMLPGDLFPLLRGFAGLPTSADADATLLRLQDEAARTVPEGVPPTVLDRYWETFRVPFREEVNQSIRQLL
jgi:hypothetical protein